MKKILLALTLVGMTTAGASAALVDALGDRDFADATAPGGVAAFEAQNAGDPTGFNEFRGSDPGGTFGSFSFTHTFGPISGPAFLTLGIFDHDSTTLAQPGLSITFDGVAQDVSMWAGISALPAFQYIRDMAVDSALLADGQLDVVITALDVGNNFSGNGIGIDFSELHAAATPVPLPASGVLLFGALGGLMAARRKKKAA